MNRQELPLFPLDTVLFPQGLLPLRIFEARYLDMVSECMKNAGGFGVVAIREGRETERAARFHEVGTVARIVDFDRLDDGLLGITCRGEERLRVVRHRVQADQLVVGEVELLAEEPRVAPPDTYRLLVQLLRNILEREELRSYTGLLEPDWGSASWVSFRLAELLPIPLLVKQALLQVYDPVQRLSELYAILREQPDG